MITADRGPHTQMNALGAPEPLPVNSYCAWASSWIRRIAVEMGFATTDAG